MKLLFLILGFQALFTSDLKEVDESFFDNSLVIVLNSPYCSDCLDIIEKSSYLWKEKLNTIVITKSVKKKKSAQVAAFELKKKLKYNEILFVESSPRNFMSNIKFRDTEISKSPAIIIRYQDKEVLLMFDDLFAKKYTPKSVAETIKLKLKELDVIE
ncbi:MAG: hypothetical protein CVV22_09255 [Ignavibacteriae bacterium HGW-Ignavibacteriae-1]|nr:MAG: hypothetical protein CVV22_09255 [Ignavibacteriae bacterium HGW-Ignavibacteriae-1]